MKKIEFKNCLSLLKNTRINNLVDKVDLSFFYDYCFQLS